MPIVSQKKRKMKEKCVRKRPKWGCGMWPPGLLPKPIAKRKTEEAEIFQGMRGQINATAWIAVTMMEKRRKKSPGWQQDGGDDLSHALEKS